MAYPATLEVLVYPIRLSQGWSLRPGETIIL
jgi:hypothetical protein